MAGVMLFTVFPVGIVIISAEDFPPLPPPLFLLLYVLLNSLCHSFSDFFFGKGEEGEEVEGGVLYVT